ncbi:MAG: hypothetical protein FWD16_01250 [Clostridia bacterium]|nr:hypothetical protein [Clostridia bacterium]
MDFVAYLRKNNWGIVWSAANDWWVTLYMQAKCKISLKENNWVISLCLTQTSEYDESVTSKSSQDPVQYNDPDESVIKTIKSLLETHKKAVNMGQKGRPSMYQAQKAVKPLIEDIIPEYLDGNMKVAALDLAAWLRENKMKPGWTLTNWWNVNCKGKPICKIHLGEDVWRNSQFWFVELRLSHMNEYRDLITDEKIQKIIWSSIKYCGSCGGCAPGRDATLFGKECKGLCHALRFTVCDPDQATVNRLKELLKLEQMARTKG